MGIVTIEGNLNGERKVNAEKGKVLSGMVMTPNETT